MKLKLVMLILILYASSMPINAELKKEDIQVHFLDNGLKVLLLEDHDIPNVAMYTFYRVGSRNEYPRMTGISHFIEHMMFNGTKKVGPGEFDRKMEFMGGSNNAYTGLDMTAYTDWFPSAALEAMIEIEADRMQGATFDAKVLESERGVVSEERRLSVDNNNQSLLDEQVTATAITAHPYHWGVIGWMSDILNWKRDEIIEYYRTFYAPNNAVMIIVGDFNSDETLKLIKKYYATVKKGPLPPKVTTVEPAQLGPKTVNIEKEAQMPFFLMVYHAPKCSSDDYYPMSILGSVLLQGKSSRLYKRLVREEQLAISVSGGIYETSDPYLFSFSVQPKQDADLDRIEAIIIEELEKIKREGITRRELTKVLNSVKTRFFNSLQTIAGIANLIGRAEVLHGDYGKAFSRMDYYSNVKLEDVRKAANKYFTENNKTVGKLIPSGGAK